MLKAPSYSATSGLTTSAIRAIVTAEEKVLRRKAPPKGHLIKTIRMVRIYVSPKNIRAKQAGTTPKEAIRERRLT